MRPTSRGGGALFKRTLTLSGGSSELVVDEEFQPHDLRSTARLESISGFAFAPGDRLLIASRELRLAILHGKHLVVLRWHDGDVARVDTRQTRGAEIVTLVFARRSVELRLGVFTARDAARGAPAARRETAVAHAGKWRNGRRSRLKSGRGNSCGFDSHLPHQI